MTAEREEALELARKAGFNEDAFHILANGLTNLVRLAKQCGAEEQKRKDVEICRQWERQDVKADCCDVAQDECCMSLAALIEEQP